MRKTKEGRNSPQYEDIQKELHYMYRQAKEIRTDGKCVIIGDINNSHNTGGVHKETTLFY